MCGADRRPRRSGSSSTRVHARLEAGYVVRRHPSEQTLHRCWRVGVVSTKAHSLYGLFRVSGAPWFYVTGSRVAGAARLPVRFPAGRAGSRRDGLLSPWVRVAGGSCCGGLRGFGEDCRGLIRLRATVMWWPGLIGGHLGTRAPLTAGGGEVARMAGHAVPVDAASRARLGAPRLGGFSVWHGRAADGRSDPVRPSRGHRVHRGRQ